jgi:hypothetical protein
VSEQLALYAALLGELVAEAVLRQLRLNEQAAAD